MRILFSLIALSVFNLASFSQERDLKNTAFTLDAKIEGVPGNKVYLTYGGFHNSKIDSAEIINEEFRFVGNTDEPVPAMIFTPDFRVRFDLYVEAGRILINGSASALNDLVIQGPPTTLEYAAFNKAIMDNRKRVNDLYQQAYKMREAGDSLQADGLDKLVDSLYKSEFSFRRNFIEKNPKSYISAHELYSFSNVKTVAEANRLFESLDRTIKNSSQGRELEKRIQLLGRIQVGEKALPFVQQDVAGKKISLDEFKGKYTLVEFWASWCGPCRAENPNLLSAYNQYKDKGFTILGVSLDHVREAWIKAIEQDGMPWTQVSDLKGWKNEVATMYGIKAVPANFLVSPDGKILALDLRGEKLTEKLAEIF